MTQNLKFEREITDIDYSKIPERIKPKFNNIKGLRIGITNLKIDFDNLNKDNLVYADDNYLVFYFDKDYKFNFLFNTVFTIGFFLCFFLPVIFSSPKEKTPFFFLLAIFALGSIIFWQIYTYFTAAKKEFVLNRKKGTITFPDRFHKKTNTMPFNRVIWSTERFRLGLTLPSHILGLTIRSPKSYFFNTDVCIYFENIKEDFREQYLNLSYDKLSLITWYMDKNRPLPSGKMFDAFRKQDFERRKSAGFPEPLYGAAFLIMEDTTEQQLERRKIGGW